MYRTIVIVIFSGIVTSIAGCSAMKKNRSSIEVTGSWINKEKVSSGPYNSVFILALTPDLEKRTILEKDLATAARANGIKGYMSLDVFGPVTASNDTAVIAALMRKIKQKECETILTVSLIDSKSETKYIPGSSYSYDPLMYGPYYGTFGGYYYHASTSYYSPGYYNTNSTYYLETNLYDATDQGILFSIQTKAMNPPEINKASQQFTETLIEELKNNGLLKKGS